MKTYEILWEETSKYTALVLADTPAEAAEKFRLGDHGDAEIYDSENMCPEFMVRELEPVDSDILEGFLFNEKE